MISLVIAALGFVLVINGMPTSEVLLDPPTKNPSSTDRDEFDGKLLGGGFEGDMFLPNGTTRGVAVFGESAKWPNGVIPYQIAPNINTADRKKITDAMNDFMWYVGIQKPGSQERVACVYFRPRQANDRSYIDIQYGTGCGALLGYVPNGPSLLVLQQNGCFNTGTIQHELMHTLGFHHEQSRPDRDNYLQVHLENVEEKDKYIFQKLVWGSTALQQGTPYDFASVMHYGPNAFSKNGKPTLVARQAGVTFGNAQKLSATDIVEVKRLYRC
jgi:hypothetical protein